MTGKQDKLAKRIQEFRIQDELANSGSVSSTSTSTNGLPLVGTLTLSSEVRIEFMEYLYYFL
jgi:hypothetical protein